MIDYYNKLSRFSQNMVLLISSIIIISLFITTVIIGADNGDSYQERTTVKTKMVEATKVINTKQPFKNVKSIDDKIKLAEIEISRFIIAQRKITTLSEEEIESRERFFGINDLRELMSGCYDCDVDVWISEWIEITKWALKSNVYKTK